MSGHQSLYAYYHCDSIYTVHITVCTLYVLQRFQENGLGAYKLQNIALHALNVCPQDMPITLD